MSTVLKRHSRVILQQAKGDCPRIESTQIRWFLGQSDRRLDIVRSKALKNKLAKREPLGSHPLSSDGSLDGQAGG
jgi:hypothetical protein